MLYEKGLSKHSFSKTRVHWSIAIHSMGYLYDVLHKTCGNPAQVILVGSALLTVSIGGYTLQGQQIRGF